MAKNKSEYRPYHPVPYTAKEVRMLRNLANGEAAPHEQTEALKFIIERVSGAYDLPYHESDRDTAFACGRQFVGKQLVKLLTIRPESLVNNNGEHL